MVEVVRNSSIGLVFVEKIVFTHCLPPVLIPTSTKMFLIFISCLALIDSVFGGNALRKGCTADDLVFFNDVFAELQDVLTVAQNSGANTDEFLEFFESATSEDLVYEVKDENGFVYVSYSSRDELISNFVSDTPAGRIWLYGMAGYGKCSRNSNGGNGGLRTAKYIARGGNHFRGENENTMFLGRYEIDFEKQGSNDWTITSVLVEAVSDFGSFTS